MSGDFSVLLQQWRAGSAQAGDRVIEAAYNELRRLARYYMRQERAGHTLQATALVHEAYVRLCRATPPDVESRDAFVRLMGAQLRHLLIDHARRRGAAKRGGAQPRASIEDVDVPEAVPDADDAGVAALDRLDAALPKLAAAHPRVAKVVELRFFADMSIEETAQALGVATGTVKRDFAFARAWLIREVSQPAEGGRSPGP
jgi:RNA polymerase sigma factor (TIGR02999 family)